MAHPISPNIPEDPIYRNGLLNKTQIMRNYLKEHPHATREQAIKHLQKKAPGTTFNYGSTLFRNVNGENRLLALHNTPKETEVPLLTSENSSGFLIASNSADESEQSEQFGQFLKHFRTMCQNPYLRGIAKTCIEVVEENETQSKKIAG